MMGSSSQRVNLTRRSGRLRRLQRRSPQRQVVKLEVEPESEILAVVASDAGGPDAASAAHKLLCRAAGQTRATADVERPILVVFASWACVLPRFLRREASWLLDCGSARRPVLDGWLEVAALVVGAGRLLRWGLLGVDSCGSHQDRRQNQPTERSRVRESLRTFESFILLPLPGRWLRRRLNARSEKRLEKSVSACSRRDCTRSRQAPYYQL